MNLSVKVFDSSVPSIPSLPDTLFEDTVLGRCA